MYDHARIVFAQRDAVDVADHHFLVAHLGLAGFDAFGTLESDGDFRTGRAVAAEQHATMPGPGSTSARLQELTRAISKATTTTASIDQCPTASIMRYSAALWR